MITKDPCDDCFCVRCNTSGGKCEHLAQDTQHIASKDNPKFGDFDVRWKHLCARAAQLKLGSGPVSELNWLWDRVLSSYPHRDRLMVDWDCDSAENELWVQFRLSAPKGEWPRYFELTFEDYGVEWQMYKGGPLGARLGLIFGHGGCDGKLRRYLEEPKGGLP